LIRNSGGQEHDNIKFLTKRGYAINAVWYFKFGRVVKKLCENPIHLELGCGKGQFISNLAIQNQQNNYIAIDLVDAMLGLAKRNVEQIYNENNIEPTNIVLTRFDIERILLILEEKDKIERIYINFCNFI